LTIGVLGLYALFLAEPIHLTTADLGRHLKNGELVWRHPDVLFTNFYSYTEPSHPFINHHWGSGVIFFLIWKLFGFEGAHLFSIALNLFALALMVRAAQARAGIGMAVVLAVLVIPLLASRAEVRPEAFSYLLTAIFFQILCRFKEGKLSRRHLWWLPELEVLWVNLHIYFIMGPILIGAFLAESLCDPGRRPQAKGLMKLFVVTIAATALNPFGVQGMLAPLTIFQGYGYRLFENQSIPFLMARFSFPRLWLLIGVFGLLTFGVLAALVRSRRSIPLAELLIALFVSALAWRAYRNLTLFGLLALPVLASAVQAFIATWQRRLKRPMALLAAVVLALTVWGPRTVCSPPPPSERGLGLEEGAHSAAGFVKRERLEGPIFNNYDIGGYIIFHLFPQHRVFVDNRPEAYSAAFFKDWYIPMQEDEARWREADARYGFNLILFHRNDLTPWGQRFLITRVEDSAWAPVFVDDEVIIFLKRAERNRSVIERHEIPRSTFSVVKTP
jgi:hypothetical protein